LRDDAEDDSLRSILSMIFLYSSIFEPESELPKKRARKKRNFD